ncbi:hypothetical protein CQ020_19030 [Arthrobacter sp. MYb23]|uniref:hypothetical protein n=1 Tax=unclassified Arthrobacter TaxID=235627 RepID=UPI000CFD1DD2|nr:MULTISPECIES: hypothetical protein [unclassified Arthrobacter]PRB39208.1 hypothetical protein CQ038_18900 [Arthrobacter sp. MYb51]PRB93247.1 hypothetical protein CQ020_19030 [Arthrobacter sp. MYb23]
MNNLIFWIIVCSWLIPLGIRMYNRSRARRIQHGDFRAPEYPQQNLPGPGYPQQDYRGQDHTGQGYPSQNYPSQNFPSQGYPGQGNPGQGYPGQGYPGQGYPGQGYPGQGYSGQGYPGYPSERAVIRPVDDAPQSGPPSSPSSPSTFPAAGGSEPQGYRARKLAELDAKFSNGEIAMEDYMRQRGDIMNG